MFSWRTLAKRAAAVAVAGVTIYVVLPSVTRVRSAWPRLSKLNLIWFAVAVVAEVAHFLCTFALQRLALRTKGWFAVVTAVLTCNAITNIMPGADAAGAVVQFRMLAAAGIDVDTAVSGLTAFSLIQIGGLLALPISRSAMVAGTPVGRGLVNTAIVGAVGFVLFAAFGLVFLRTDRPLAWLGRNLQSLWNRLRRHRPPLTGLSERLLRDRNAVRSALGAQWKKAVLLCAARLGTDFSCLLAVLWATGSHPRPSLVLLAYAVAGVVGLLPSLPEASVSSRRA